MPHIWGQTKQYPIRASSSHQLNKIISAVLFVSLAICFILQTSTQIEKFLDRKVVQSTDTYVPDSFQLPTLIVCREKKAAIDKSLLQQKGLPRNMFSGLPLDLNLVSKIPFPDLQETWDMVTMNLTAEGKHQGKKEKMVSGLDVSELNTIFQGRCYKIDNDQSFSGGTRVFSEIKFKTDKRDVKAYKMFFAYNVNEAGVIIDYVDVPYEEIIISNREFVFLHIG